MNNWITRHAQAWDAPRGMEVPIVGLIKSWLDYGQRHRAQYAASIGDDYVLGPEWAQIGMALLTLLNGDLGRLDGGSLDGIIRDAMLAQGFDPNTL